MAGAMVISEWHVANQPNAQGEFIAIRGRSPGFLSWILSLLGVERGVRMVATAQHIRFQEGDLGGSATKIIHLDKICSTHYGYTKPWKEAFGVIIFLGPILAPIGAAIMANGMQPSLIGGALGVFVSIGIAAIYYAFNKRMSVGLVEMSGIVNQIVFKRSVLEGINLDEQSSAQASDVIQWLMDSARTGSGGVATSSTQQGHI
tara:strand:- start:111 stop:719 length:609 start_codon:yes stop_codon:yes gene_type:complete